MRKGCLALVAIVAILIVVAAGVLYTGYYGDLPTVQLSAHPSLGELAAQIPSDAGQAIVAPAFAPLIRTLAAHRITRNAIEKYEQSGRIKLFAAIIGSAPFAAWSDERAPRLLVESGGFRRSLLLLAARFASIDIATHGKWIAIGGFTPSASTRIDASTAAAGQLFVLHREESDRYPPIGRPAITAITLAGEELRGISTAPGAAMPVSVRGDFDHPDGALLSVAFWQPHAVLKDLDRFLPVDLQRLAQQGAMLTIYDVETSGLLPRPKGLIALPETPESIDAAASLFNSAAFEQLGDSAVVSREVAGIKVDRGRRLGATIEIARAHGKVYIGFDAKSLESFLTGPRTKVTAPAGGAWSVRADAVRLRPVVEEVADHRGLRFVASRVSRSARQMRSLMEMLPHAKEIKAEKSLAGGLERVDLLVSSK